MSTDGGLWPLFKSHLSDGFHFQRIESGVVGSGVPDLNYCAEGQEGWIEFKQTSTLKVPLRPEQVAWISRRTRSGGRVFIAVRLTHPGGPRKGHPSDTLWLLDGRQVVTIHKSGLHKELALLITSGGPRNWDWVRVREILLA